MKSRSHFLSIARFDLGLMMRSPVYWIVVVIFFTLAMFAVGSENISLGGGAQVHKNAPLAIIIANSAFVLFYLFAVTAFVASAVVRDDETKFGPILRATPITKFDYLFGRFTGSFMGAALAYLALPLGLYLATFMPWIDPQRLGPNRLLFYVYGYAIGALPPIFLMSALFFALATTARSMLATYLGAVAVFILYFAYSLAAGQMPELRTTLAYFDPFGAGVIGLETEYWTPAEANVRLPPLIGPILWHALIWLGVAAAFLAVAYNRYQFAERGLSTRAAKRAMRADARAEMVAVNAAPEHVDVVTHGLGLAVLQLWARTRLEVGQVLRSPAFLVLLVLAVAFSALVLYLTPELFGAPSLAISRHVVEQVSAGFGFFTFIIIVFYAGELVWRERQYHVDGLIDASAMPNWGYVVPKMLALCVVIVAVLLMGLVVGIGYQISTGFTDIEFGKYLSWFLLPRAIGYMLLAALAVFIQTLSPNKYVGWGVLVVYFIFTISARLLGLEHHLYLYPSAPGMPLSDMNAAGIPVGGEWFTAYWSAFALILLVGAHLLWARGVGTPLRTRLAGLPSRLRGAAGLFAGLCALIFVGIGGFIYHNTNQLNTYRTTTQEEAQAAEYEKRFLKYETLPQPAVAAVTINVDLYPAELRMAAHGTYLLKNLTNQPITQIHARFGEIDSPSTVSIAGAQRVSYDERYKYSIFVLTAPMRPSETRVLSFTSARAQIGFRNSGNDVRLVHNGTFLNNFEIAPVIGMDRQSLLKDKSKRRKYGLPPELRVAKLEDRSAQVHPYFPADWATTDITVSTQADQIPIAPGKRIADVVSAGRRTARFVSGKPILNFYSIQSAAYAVKRTRHAGINLEVYYHPAHYWNVDRMMTAMAQSLDYYQANFGPYQFDQARILEMPAYAKYAQSFANTVPYSEDIGFTTDIRNPDKIDMVTYVTAHEIAHQYWAHQIVGANMQGATVLSETLAQYSALMVMKHRYGPDKIRRFLHIELDNYLKRRFLEGIEEVPLGRVENQQYIHYNKGSLVMYLLQDRLGEDRVNAALRALLAKYKFKGAPYPRSVDLVDALRAQASTPEQQALITDLFERIIVYDLKAKTAAATKRADGRWDVRFLVDAKKFVISGKGVEKAIPFAENIALGVFSAKPGDGAFDQRSVLWLQNSPIHTGTQWVHLVVPTKPRYVGVDPYNMFITRTADDNLAGVP